jgi:hypothetical protein
MPDDPKDTGGNDPVKSYGGSALPEGSFKQSGTGTPSNVAQDAANALSNLQGSEQLLQNLVKLVESLKNPAEAIDKSFQKWRDQLKYAVDAAGDVEDGLKEVMSINKKFAAQGIFGMNKKSYAEVKKYLGELHKAQLKLQGNRQFLSPEGQKDLEKAVSHTGRALEKLEESMKGVADANDEIDQDVFLEIAKNVRQATVETSKFGTSVSRGGKISTGIQQLAKIMGSGMFEKFAKAGAISTELGNWRRQVQKEGAKNFGQLKADFARKYKIGSEKMDEIAAFRRTRAGKAAGAGPISGRIGLGGILDRAAEKVAGMEEKGGLRGWLGRQATRTLEAGGGEAGTGLGMRTLGVAARAGEGVMGEIGAAAVPLGILNELRKIYDANIEQNQEIFKTAGGGGLFTGGGGNARQIFQAMKYNLAAGGMTMGGFGVSTLGVDRTQNMKILEAYQDLGIAVPELTHELEQNRMTGVITDRRARGFGGVQQLAYTTGKQLGFDTGETTRQNLKYLLQFGQTQESVNHLFGQFLSDTKASGITVTKYLSIIDGITSTFDHMGKSIESVTGILRVMGATGLGSADDLKQALEFMIGGPQKTLEQSAAILQMAGPGGMGEMGRGARAQAKIQADAVTKSLATQGITGQDLSTPLGIANAISAVGQRTDIDATTRQTLNQNLENLDKTVKSAGIFEAGAKGRNVVDTAQDLKNLHLASVDMALNVRAMLEAIKKTPGASVPTIFAGKGGAALAGIAKALGATEDFTRNMPEEMLLMGNTFVKDLREASQDQLDQVATVAPENIQQAYATAVKAGFAPAGITDVKKQAAVIKEVAGGPNADKFATLLATNTDILKTVGDGNSALVTLTGLLAKDLEKKIPTPEEIAMATKKSTELLTQALDNLRVKVGEVLTWLTDHFGGGKTPEQTRVEAGTATAAERATFETETGKANFWGDVMGGNWGAAARTGKDLIAKQLTGLVGTPEALSPEALAMISRNYPMPTMPEAAPAGRMMGSTVHTTYMNAELSTITPVALPPVNSASESGSGLAVRKGQ